VFCGDIFIRNHANWYLYVWANPQRESVSARHIPARAPRRIGAFLAYRRLR